MSKKWFDIKAAAGAGEIAIYDEIGGTAYRNIQQAFMTDPSTSAAWTAAGVNAAQFGLEG